MFGAICVVLFQEMFDDLVEVQDFVESEPGMGAFIAKNTAGMQMIMQVSKCCVSSKLGSPSPVRSVESVFAFRPTIFLGSYAETKEWEDLRDPLR